MTFETLADKYNLTRRDIYGRFSNPEQLVEIKPDSPRSRDRVIDDTRSLPIRSTIRDTERISKFLVTGPRPNFGRVSTYLNIQNPGLLFTGKQLLLQTGNTFAETRIFNPASPIINTVPFLHTPRLLGSSFFSNRGALQDETVNSFNVPSTSFRNLLGQQIRNVVRTVSSPLRTITGGPKKSPLSVSDADKFYLRPEENFPRHLFVVAGNYRMFRVPLFDSQPLAYRGEKKIPLSTRVVQNGQEVTRRLAGYALRANAYVSSYLPSRRTDSSLLLSTEPLASENINQFSTITQAARSLVPSGGQVPRAGAHAVRRRGEQPLTFNSAFRQYVTNIGRGRLEGTNGFFVGNPSTLDTVETIEDPTNQGPRKFGRTRLADSFNVLAPQTGSRPHSVSYQSIVESEQWKQLNQNKDIIKFIFKDVNQSEAVHFRALLSDLRQNLRADYNETKYVGRTERFVNYSGAKRSVTMTFNIVAFSESELDNMWLRINYLTGLAFPRGVSNSGFMIPPLFRITVGDIYVDHPCYIETLDFDFLDNTITFDVNKEVSQVINVKLSIVLLEKRSKFIDSPYYGITEKLQPTIASPIQESPELRRPDLSNGASPRPLVGVLGGMSAGSDRPPVPTRTTTIIARPTASFVGFGGGGGFSGGGSGGTF